jgi:hypothetical protein
MRRWLRSPREYAFRLRQEFANLYLLARPPSLPGPVPWPLPFLPVPPAIAERMRGSAFEKELISIADLILEHRFPLLGTTLDTGPDIHWRRDYSSGIETDTRYFRNLDPLRTGDPKRIWELNRHQHLIVLGQAWLFTGREAYLKEIHQQLEGWWVQNPFQRGINWASALEVAFRALSWLWLYQFIGDRLPEEFIERLYQHGSHLAVNLSQYHSPNTHLLGEAVALHALGRMFGIDRWESTGAEVVDEQMRRQIREDGSHVEQSTYYHVYALDMFLFHAIIRSEVPAWRPRQARMAEFLRALIGPGRKLAFLGDDDGGRFFHPYGPRNEFGCATLAACAVFLNRPDLWPDPADLSSLAAWWLNPADPRLRASEPSSRFFKDAGVAIMTRGDMHIIVDAGPFGPWGSGHSHSDTLSVVVRLRGEEILIDPGTYTYSGSERDWFRGSIAHNTIRIDGRDQAVPVNPFRWAQQPSVRVREWRTNSQEDFLDAECRYMQFIHRRRIRFIKPHLLLIVDEIEGPPGEEHMIEQLWHPGMPVTGGGTRFRIGSRCTLVLDHNTALEEGWRSHALLNRESSPILRLSMRAGARLNLASGLILDGAGDLVITPDEFRLRTSGGTDELYSRS